MTPAERQERIRQLKRELKTFSIPLQDAKQVSRVSIYYGKHDRKRKAFRDYEYRRDLYKSVKRNRDQLQAELDNLVAAERAHHAGREGKRPGLKRPGRFRFKAGHGRQRAATGG